MSTKGKLVERLKRQSENTNKGKNILFRRLKKEHVFWSYDQKSVTLAQMSDNFLIEKVLYHLDTDDVLKLFKVYSKEQVKDVWKNRLCPLGDYFDRMNYYYAVVFFGIKNPQRYIKIQSNRYIKNIINESERIIASNGGHI